MKLTESCKIEFERWYKERQINSKENKLLTPSTKILFADNHLDYFMLAPLSMQIGVLQLYFDSVGIGIVISFENYSKDNDRFEIYCNGWGDDKYAIRQEAWEEAIKKANEIRNKQLKK